MITTYIDLKINGFINQIKELHHLIKVLNNVKGNKNLGECDFFKSIINR